MTEEIVRRHLSANIAMYRKRAGLTQAELSERINYSDKSVSKWERGEGIPDVTVLVLLAELFDVTVDDLLADPEKRPAPAAPRSGRTRLFITAMALGLVWLTAVVLFFLLKVVLPGTPGLWLTFIIAIPVTAIVGIVFTALWWPWIYQFLSVSVLIWSIAVSVHLCAPHVSGIFLIYGVAAVMQVLTVLWYAMRWERRRHSPPVKD